MCALDTVCEYTKVSDSLKALGLLLLLTSRRDYGPQYPLTVRNIPLERCCVSLSFPKVSCETLRCSHVVSVQRKYCTHCNPYCTLWESGWEFLGLGIPGNSWEFPFPLGAFAPAEAFLGTEIPGNSREFPPLV